MHKINKTNHSLSGSNKLLDLAITTIGLKNDAALSRVLGVSPIIISKLRHGKSYIGPSMLIRLHEQTGLSIREMKGYLSLDTTVKPEAHMETAAHTSTKNEEETDHEVSAMES